MRLFATKRIPRPSQLTSFVQHYQSNGHKIASRIDPLSIAQPLLSKDTFEPEHWSLSELESLSEYRADPCLTSEALKNATVMDLQQYLKATYAKNVTVEFSHVQDEDEKQWLYDHYEQHMASSVSDKAKVKAL